MADIRPSSAPSTFLRRVGFDTFDNKDASDFSLTLKAKHKNYSYTRRSRTFLCGTDQHEYSQFALEWLIDELVDDGDEVVCLRVVDKDSKISSDSSMQERLYRQEARKLLNEIIEKNEDDKAISIVLEFAVGKVHDTIQRMVLSSHQISRGFVSAYHSWLLDPYIRTCHPHRWYPRSFTGWYSGFITRFRIQILSPAFTRSRYCRAAIKQT